jgi:prolyl 4-hydroxylase
MILILILLIVFVVCFFIQNERKDNEKKACLFTHKLNACLIEYKPQTNSCVGNGDNKEYFVYQFRNFLTNEECDQLIKDADKKGYEKSIVNKSDSVGDEYNNTSRVSETSWLNFKDSKIDEKLTFKASEYTQRSPYNQEELQVVKYEPGSFFKLHYDPSENNPDISTREYTFLIYLNDDFEGGETHFPEINVSVKPEKGMAILFRSLDDNGSIIPESLHAGTPVISGVKYVCNKWVHNKQYRNNYSNIQNSSTACLLPV